MAQYEEFTIDQGTDVAIELHLTNLDGSKKDLDAHTVFAKMKKTYNSDSSDSLTFNTLVSDPATDGTYVYDVELTYQDSAAKNIIERVLEGKIFVTPSVTR
jgi:hypothetical protein